MKATAEQVLDNNKNSPPEEQKDIIANMKTGDIVEVNKANGEIEVLHKYKDGNYETIEIRKIKEYANDVIDATLLPGLLMVGQGGIGGRLNLGLGITTAIDQFLDNVIPGRRFIKQTQPVAIEMEYLGCDGSVFLSGGGARSLCYLPETGELVFLESLNFGAKSTTSISAGYSIIFHYNGDNDFALENLTGWSNGAGSSASFFGNLGVGVDSSLDSTSYSLKIDFSVGISATPVEMHASRSYTNAALIIKLDPRLNFLLKYIMGIRRRQ